MIRWGLCEGRAGSSGGWGSYGVIVAYWIDRMMIVSRIDISISN